MTRAERIKIRAKRMRKRDERIKKRKESECNKDSAITTTPATTTTTTTSAIIPDNIKLTIEICIHTFRYQRRLNWMLSSLLEQVGDVPSLIINVSHTDLDGCPTTGEVCKFFRDKGLNIVETLVTQAEVPNRAIARNKQATNTKADYILFADSDMVYSELFFDDLQKKLRNELRDVQLVMGADRISLDEKTCIKYFEEDKEPYPRAIKDVANIVKMWKIKWVTGRGTAPGNFQLISGKILKEKCKGKITDRPKDFWRLTKGDRALRVRTGGRCPIITLEQWHLNHDRGGPDIQR